MQTEFRHIDDITRYEKNPRNNAAAIDGVAASLRNFGWQQPIVVDRDNVIICGDTRYQAARKLIAEASAELSHAETEEERVRLTLRVEELQRVPIKIADELSPAQVKAYRIADNSTGEVATWDEALLVQELSDLAEASDPIADGDQMFAQLLIKDGVADRDDSGGPVADAPAQIDRAAELVEKYQTAPHQLWLITSPDGERTHRLLCGDSTNADDMARLMDGKKAGLLCSDPPYGVNWKDSGNNNVAGDLNNGTIPGFFGIACDQMEPGRAVLMFGGTANFSLYSALFGRELQITPALLFWRKANFVLRHHDYHSQYEAIFYGWTPGGDAATRWHGDRKQSDVWDVPHDVAPAEKQHVTQKPVELFAIPIRNHTRPGEVCLEPFAGSGSQLVAAEGLGRVCYGMELEPHYIAVILQRMEDLGCTVRLEDTPPDVAELSGTRDQPSDHTATPETAQPDAGPDTAAAGDAAASGDSRSTKAKKTARKRTTKKKAAKKKASRKPTRKKATP